MIIAFCLFHVKQIVCKLNKKKSAELGLKYKMQLDQAKAEFEQKEFASESEDDNVSVIVSGMREIKQLSIDDEFLNNSREIVEAVKTVSDLFMPVSGEVLELNEELDANPELVNTDPYEAGWMVKVRLSDSSEVDSLLSADDYQALIG